MIAALLAMQIAGSAALSITPMQAVPHVTWAPEQPGQGQLFVLRVAPADGNQFRPCAEGQPVRRCTSSA